MILFLIILVNLITLFINFLISVNKYFIQMKAKIANLKKFIKNIETRLPVCEICSLLKNRYCLETICTDKYHCSSCNIPVQLNKHYLHSYITLSFNELNDMIYQKKQKLHYYEWINGEIKQLSRKCTRIIDDYQHKIKRIKQNQEQLQILSTQIEDNCSLIKQQQVKLQEIFARGGNNFSQKQNQIMRQLGKNNLDIHSQIELSQYIYDQVIQIRKRQIEFDGFCSLYKVEQFISKQKKILNNMSSASEYIQVQNDNEFQTHYIKVIMLKNKLDIFKLQMGNYVNINKNSDCPILIMPYDNQNKGRLFKLIFKFALQKLLRIKKFKHWHKGIDFNKQEMMMKNKVYQIYKIHKSKLCNHRKSLKQQLLLTLFEANQD